LIKNTQNHLHKICQLVFK